MPPPANVRYTANAPFPSLVTGTGPITVTKTNGIWSIALQMAPLAQQVPPFLDTTHSYFTLWNSNTNAFAKCLLSDVLAQAASINSSIYSTRTVAAASIIPGSFTAIRTSGYSVAGDGGAAIYVHASGSTVGGFQSADGQWWQLAPQGFVTPEMFGADGTGTNDTQGIAQATALGWPIVFQPRIYKIIDTGNGDHGVTVPGVYGSPQLSNSPGLVQTWIGAGMGRTVLQVQADTTWDPFNFQNFIGANIPSVKILLRGITFDGNNHLNGVSSRYPGLIACVFSNGLYDSVVEECEFIGWTQAGINTNVSTNFTVRNCRVKRFGGITGSIANFGISFQGATSYATIENNYVEGSNITTNGQYHRVIGNVVNGWGFSAGINMQPGDHNIYIAGNHIIGSGNIPADLNGYYADGMELYPDYTTIVGNTVENCPGAGIGCNGHNSVVIGNVCRNNGQAPGAQPQQHSGISVFWASSSNGGFNSFIKGNQCMDTGAGTQSYGFAEGGAGLLTGVVIGRNHFAGNVTGPILLLSGSVTTIDPSMQSSMATKTANYTLTSLDQTLTFNGAGSLTLTLQAASNFPSRVLTVRTIANQTVVSASSNVVPLAGGAAGTAILAATAGKWATLQSDGTNWIIMASN
jgi:hypothetical protein